MPSCKRSSRVNAIPCTVEEEQLDNTLITGKKKKKSLHRVRFTKETTLTTLTHVLVITEYGCYDSFLHPNTVVFFMFSPNYASVAIWLLGKTGQKSHI